MERIENGQVVRYVLEMDEVGDVHEVPVWRRPATPWDYVCLAPRWDEVSTWIICVVSLAGLVWLFGGRMLFT